MSSSQPAHSTKLSEMTSASPPRTTPMKSSSSSTSSPAPSPSAAINTTTTTSSYKKPNAKHECLPGCTTYPRCACRMKSVLREKIKNKFDLASLFGLTRESEQLSGIRLIADLVEDGKLSLAECIEKRAIERLTDFLKSQTLAFATLDTIGVLLFYWLRSTTSKLKKCINHGGIANSSTVCHTCRVLASRTQSSLPSSLPKLPMELDDWLVSPAASKLVAATLPFIRKSATRHVACYVLLHFCDGARSATTLINTPNAVNCLLEVYTSLVDTKDNGVLLELTSIITGICVKPTKDTISILAPIAPALLSRFRLNTNSLLTAYICKALGRLCDGQKELAELVLNANISSYLLFLYWSAVERERKKEKSPVDGVLFEDIFGLLGLLVYYENPQNPKLLSIGTKLHETPFILSQEFQTRLNVLRSIVTAKYIEKKIERTEPIRSDKEVQAEQASIVKTYAKNDHVKPDLVHIISMVLDMVENATSKVPSTTEWYHIQCAAWQISMILTNGITVREDNILRRQRLIDAGIFKQLINILQKYHTTMPSACLWAIVQAISYGVIGATSSQICAIVFSNFVIPSLEILQNPKVTTRCILCILHSINVMLARGECDRAVLSNEDSAYNVFSEDDASSNSSDETDSQYSTTTQKLEEIRTSARKWQKKRVCFDRSIVLEEIKQQKEHHDVPSKSTSNISHSIVANSASMPYKPDGSEPHVCDMENYCSICQVCDSCSTRRCPHLASNNLMTPYNSYVGLFRFYGIEATLVQVYTSSSSKSSKDDRSICAIVTKIMEYFNATPNLIINNPFLNLPPISSIPAIESTNASSLSGSDSSNTVQQSPPLLNFSLQTINLMKPLIDRPRLEQTTLSVIIGFRRPRSRSNLQKIIAFRKEANINNRISVFPTSVQHNVHTITQCIPPLRRTIPPPVNKKESELESVLRAFKDGARQFALTSISDTKAATPLASISSSESPSNEPLRETLTMEDSDAESDSLRDSSGQISVDERSRKLRHKRQQKKERAKAAKKKQNEKKVKESKVKSDKLAIESLAGKGDDLDTSMSDESSDMLDLNTISSENLKSTGSTQSTPFVAPTTNNSSSELKEVRTLLFACRHSDCCSVPKMIYNTEVHIHLSCTEGCGISYHYNPPLYSATHDSVSCWSTICSRWCTLNTVPHAQYSDDSQAASLSGDQTAFYSSRRFLADFCAKCITPECSGQINLVTLRKGANLDDSHLKTLFQMKGLPRSKEMVSKKLVENDHIKKQKDEMKLREKPPKKILGKKSNPEDKRKEKEPASEREKVSEYAETSSTPTVDRKLAPPSKSPYGVEVVIPMSAKPKLLSGDQLDDITSAPSSTDPNVTSTSSKNIPTTAAAPKRVNQSPRMNGKSGNSTSGRLQLTNGSPTHLLYIFPSSARVVEGYVNVERDLSNFVEYCRTFDRVSVSPIAGPRAALIKFCSVADATTASRKVPVGLGCQFAYNPQQDPQAELPFDSRSLPYTTKNREQIALIPKDKASVQHQHVISLQSSSNITNAANEQTQLPDGTAETPIGSPSTVSSDPLEQSNSFDSLNFDLSFLDKESETAPSSTTSRPMINHSATAVSEPKPSTDGSTNPLLISGNWGSCPDPLASSSVVTQPMPSIPNLSTSNYFNSTTFISPFSSLSGFSDQFSQSTSSVYSGSLSLGFSAYPNIPSDNSESLNYNHKNFSSIHSPPNIDRLSKIPRNDSANDVNLDMLSSLSVSSSLYDDDSEVWDEDRISKLELDVLEDRPLSTLRPPPSITKTSNFQHTSTDIYDDVDPSSHAHQFWKAPGNLGHGNSSWFPNVASFPYSGYPTYADTPSHPPPELPNHFQNPPNIQGSAIQGSANHILPNDPSFVRKPEHEFTIWPKSNHDEFPSSGRSLAPLSLPSVSSNVNANSNSQYSSQHLPTLQTIHDAFS